MLICAAVTNAADRFVTFKNGEASFAIAKGGQVLNIVCDSEEDAGVMMALQSHQADLKAVTGVEPQLGQTLQEQCIIIGSPKSPLIRRLIKSGKIEKKDIEGKRE